MYYNVLDSGKAGVPGRAVESVGGGAAQSRRRSAAGQLLCT